VKLVDRDLLLAQIATTCCASTSSGLRGIAVSSIAPSHRLGDDAHSSRSAAELREDAAFETRRARARTADRAAGPARPTSGSRPDDEIDGAHVDPELEARRRDEARNRGLP
jgi:hypothetical protein